ncbi:PIR protein [Plasmodium vivax]|uniref:VIR protein n=1 Tax=Plasmodium vivax TaxID=5855 RepID=A0A565A5U7_PLAVI|nr:PIR protein [Plasmodium vivax]
MGGSGLGGGFDGLIKALSFPLTLDDFYDKLNKSDKDLDKYTDECRELCSKNKSFTNIRLCSILLRFLNDSGTRTGNIKSNYDDCILFNYWMYGVLEQRYKRKYYSELIPIYGDLQTMWNSLVENKSKTSYYDKCKPDNSIVSQNDWKQRKELYDYCVNSGTIVNTANIFNHTCKDIYTYIKGKKHLYERFNEPCLSINENKCPKFYSDCEKYHPDTMLPQLYCYEDMKKEEAAAAEKALAEKQHPDISPGGTFSSDGSQSQHENTPPLIKTGDVLLGVVVTSMTSGALYKFTPLGNMLRNRFGWSNNMRNFNGGVNGLFDYAPEAFNPYSGGAEEHYIGYHPA